ncbi:MAG: hypothetical protein Q4G50_01665 [Corynebacterium sp.]|uniref:hypothetical protein n=1 Tax=Corynebacterium sp. TaxID=1720 RepID=UPI0026DEB453|nr:hypothetical protein [Corynebacterium sp.]MDO5668688.1 hypothetical protein [Corynebacterium sp.]
MEKSRWFQVAMLIAGAMVAVISVGFLFIGDAPWWEIALRVYMIALGMWAVVHYGRKLRRTA